MTVAGAHEVDEQQEGGQRESGWGRDTEARGGRSDHPRGHPQTSVGTADGDAAVVVAWRGHDFKLLPAVRMKGVVDRYLRAVGIVTEGVN